MDIIYDDEIYNDVVIPKIPIKKNLDIIGERNHIQFLSKEDRDKNHQQELIKKKDNEKQKEQSNIQHKKLYQSLKFQRGGDYNERRKRSRSREKEFNKKKINSEDKEIEAIKVYKTIKCLELLSWWQ